MLAVLCPHWRSAYSLAIASFFGSWTGRKPRETVSHNMSYLKSEMAAHIKGCPVQTQSNFFIGVIDLLLLALMYSLPSDPLQAVAIPDMIFH